MKIAKIKHVEDCFDGSFIKEIAFEQVITKELILYLGSDGKLQYFETFARPFFKFVKQGKYECKGVEGNQAIRIILKNNPEQSLAEFIEFIDKF
ncbi:MAG: hypothetical protein OEM02_04115 [Desulfobulbaceae bacterium]|nr:hypothetical protein [Desulfobulbaceae bacterium]